MSSSDVSTEKPRLKLLRVEPVESEIPKSTSPQSNPVLVEVIAVLTAISAILASKFLLLLAISAGFVLALMAMSDPNNFKIGILVVWCIGIVLPTAYLYWRGSQ